MDTARSILAVILQNKASQIIARTKEYNVTQLLSTNIHDAYVMYAHGDKL